MSTPWKRFVERWKDCTRCPLHSQRNRIVIAKGKLPCDVVFVGEAPGESENALGLPFVGPAGILLDRIVQNALEHVYPDEAPPVRIAYTNLVLCFPAIAKARGDNEPEKNEILACRERLVEFLDLCRPRLIVAVGKLSWEYLPEQWIAYREPRPSMVSITHPAAVLRAPLAQKDMMARKCEVVLATAIEEAMLRAMPEVEEQCPPF